MVTTLRKLPKIIVFSVHVPKQTRWNLKNPRSLLFSGSRDQRPYVRHLRFAPWFKCHVLHRLMDIKGCTIFYKLLMMGASNPWSWNQAHLIVFCPDDILFCACRKPQIRVRCYDQDPWSLAYKDGCQDVKDVTTNRNWSWRTLSWSTDSLGTTSRWQRH